MASLQASSSSGLVSVEAGSSRSGGGSTLEPATPLRPTTSPSGFVYPAIWSFPPFFTLQPNPSTLAHQLELWTQLVLSWARHDRVFTVNCDAADGGGQAFWNKAIKRRLLPPSLRQLMTHMAKEGHAAADPPKSTSTYLLYWRKPEEWGQLIYDWVVETGSTGSIMTLYEITEGDLVYTAEHRELPGPILRKALESLVKKGKAQLLKGEGEMGEGVRFLA